MLPQLNLYGTSTSIHISSRLIQMVPNFRLFQRFGKLGGMMLKTHTIHTVLSALYHVLLHHCIDNYAINNYIVECRKHSAYFLIIDVSTS